MLDCRRPSWDDRYGSCRVAYKFYSDNGDSYEFSEYTPSKTDAIHRASDLIRRDDIFVQVFERLVITHSFLIAEVKDGKIELADPNPCVCEYPEDQKQDVIKLADSFQVSCNYSQESYSKENSNDWYNNAHDAFRRLEEHRDNPCVTFARMHVHYRDTKEKLVCVGNGDQELVFYKEKKNGK